MTEAQNVSGLGRRIHKYRKELGLSARQLEEKMHGLFGAGCPSRHTIAKLETGAKQDITVNELLQFAIALDTSPTALICDAEQPYELADNPVCRGMQNQQVCDWLNIEMDLNDYNGPEAPLHWSAARCRIDDIHKMIEGIYTARRNSKRYSDLYEKAMEKGDLDVADLYKHNADLEIMAEKKMRKDLIEKYHVNIEPRWEESEQ